MEREELRIARKAGRGAGLSPRFVAGLMRAVMAESRRRQARRKRRV